MKVIKIGAEWCSICLVMRPRWAEIEKENPWLETVYLDYDKDKDKLEQYKVNTEELPVFIFLAKDGKKLERLTGEITKQKIAELINKYKNK